MAIACFPNVFHVVVDSHKGIHLEGPFTDVSATDSNEPVMTTTTMDSSVNVFWTDTKEREKELIGVFWNMSEELYDIISYHVSSLITSFPIFLPICNLI